MSLPRSIHSGITTDLPTFTLKVNGSEVSPDIQVNSLVVEKMVNRISTAYVILYDGDPAQETFAVSSMDNFVPGAEIEIELGYSTENETVFKGIITHHSIKVMQDKPSLLHLTCKDKAVKLTVGRKNAYFYEKKDKDILNTLIRDAGLQSEVDATNVTHPEIVQFYCTDWDFILTRAEANAKLVYNEDGKVLVKKPDFSAQPALQLLHGATMLDFEAEIDSRCQYAKVQASAWDAATQKMKDVKAKDPGVVSPGNLTSKKLSDAIGLSQYEIRHAGQIKDVELQEWADAQWLKSQLAKIRGRVRFQGHSGIKPGDMIELGGVGDRFNGKAFVSAVRHEFNDTNWETDVSFGMDPSWFHEQYEDILSNAAEGLLPAVNGLTIGIVTKLEQDPEGEDRVRVRIPMIDPSGEGVWARIACLDAGKERGSFFRPEINDEVVLGFLDDDPRNPIILGQLNSSKLPAPVQATDTNHEKGFYTREKLKLVFKDDDKSITLETPGGQSMVIDDAAGSIVITDKNGNTITLDSNGITLDSAKEIKIKGGTNVKIESSANTELKAGAQFKAEGSAGAELSTGAVATVKGSMVKIN